MHAVLWCALPYYLGLWSGAMVSWDEVAPHSCGGGVVPEWHHSCARLAWCLVAVKSTSSATAPAPLPLATACATNSNLSFIFIFHPKVPPRFTHQACNSKPLHSFLCQSWLFVLKQVLALTPIKEQSTEDMMCRQHWIQCFVQLLSLYLALLVS